MWTTGCEPRSGIRARCTRRARHGQPPKITEIPRVAPKKTRHLATIAARSGALIRFDDGVVFGASGPARRCEHRGADLGVCGTPPPVAEPRPPPPIAIGAAPAASTKQEPRRFEDMTAAEHLAAARELARGGKRDGDEDEPSAVTLHNSERAIVCHSCLTRPHPFPITEHVQSHSETEGNISMDVGSPVQVAPPRRYRAW